MWIYLISCRSSHNYCINPSHVDTWFHRELEILIKIARKMASTLIRESLNKKAEREIF